MKKLKVLSVLALCMLMLVSCGGKKVSKSETITPTVAVTEKATEGNADTKKMISTFCVISSEKLKEKSLPEWIKENEGGIPDELLKDSYIVSAYINEAGEMVIAENTEDKLGGMNNITSIEEKNDGLTYATLKDKTEKTVKCDKNAKGELFIVMEETVAAVQIGN